LNSDRLLALQDVDTETTQLEHRRSHLAELAAARAARSEVSAWERERDRLRERLTELDGLIEKSEHESSQIDQHRGRLDKQLRTVIAPREAEALQHEIQTLQSRRGELDDAELAALEEQAELDDRLSAHLGDESALRSSLAAAEEALTAAEAEIAAHLAELDARRTELRAELDEAHLRQYDHLRVVHGVAIARLVGRRCEGCHLDLSPAEVDEVKAVPPDELATCPQCNRLLVR
jgi:predicted  nucleic acid-binding Zn-ribbon protein